MKGIGWIVGLDLGQAADYTAMAAVEVLRESPGTPRNYHVRLAERAALGTPYTEIARNVRTMLAAPQMRGARLVVDATGVGAPVVDLLREHGLRPIPVWITGGDAWARDERGGYRVPKRDLAGVLQSLLGTQRLGIAKGMTATETLTRELRAFKVKINTATGSESFEAWRESDHDDLVLATALACWVGEHEGRIIDWRQSQMSDLAARLPQY